MLRRVGFVVSQLQSKGKEDNLTLSFDELLSILTKANGMGFNVRWLKSHVAALRDLKKARPFVHTSLSSLQQLKVKSNSCINKAQETKLANDARITSITQFQESITKLQGDLLFAQKDYSVF